MEPQKTIWVLGHKVSFVKSTGDFDMVMGETPPGVPGPPPHHHKKFNEVFLVLEGTMNFMVDGNKIEVQAGEAVDLPPNSLHTFENTGEQNCRWVNIHSPKGFLSFFKDMGIPEKEAGSMTKSVDQSIINKVMERAADYDMHIEV